MYVTAPIVGLGIMSAKSAMDFESSFAGVKKTVEATDAEFAEMEKQFRALSKQIPVNINDLNKYGEAAGQLGIQKENIVGFVKVIADLGATTNLTGEEGAKQLARFANIMQMSQKNFSNLGATIVDLGNNSATTEAEIMEMGLRLAGAGNVIGMTEPKILGFAAALSSVGIEAQAGGTALSKVFIELASAGGDKLAKVGKVAGMTGAQFKKAFKDDAAEATIKFVEGLGEIQKSGGDVFDVLEDLGITEVRMRDALLRAAGAGDLMRKSIELGSKAWGDNNALTEEARKRYETFESKLQVFKNRVNDVAINVGQKLLPHLTRFADTIADLAEKFGRLNPETQTTIMKIAGIAAVVGPALIILGTLASAVSNVITMVKGLSTAIVFLATNPLVALLVTLGLVATYLVGTYIVELRKTKDAHYSVSDAIRDVKKAEEELAEYRKSQETAAFQYRLALWQEEDALKKVEEKQKLYNDVLVIHGEKSEEARVALGELLGAQDNAGRATDRLTETHKKLIEEDEKLIKKEAEIKEGIEALAKAKEEASQRMLLSQDGFNQTVSIFSDMADAAERGAENINNFTRMIEALPPIPPSIQRLMPLPELPQRSFWESRDPWRNYQHGLPYVPFDNYPAILHRGEAVLTAKENSEIRKSSDGRVGLTQTFQLNFHGLTVRTDADIDAITDKVSEKIGRQTKLAIQGVY